MHKGIHFSLSYLLTISVWEIKKMVFVRITSVKKEPSQDHRN